MEKRVNSPVILFGFLTALFLTHEASASCVSPDSDVTVEATFVVQKVETAYRMCFAGDKEAKIEADGCVVYLKKSENLKKDSEESIVYAVAANGDFCKSKERKAISLKLKSTLGKCCSLRSELTSVEDEKCVLKPKPHFIKKQSLDFNKCSWQNVEWEIKPGQ